MTTRIYHNPRCSKSRTTLKLLEEQGIAPEVVEYLNTPPSVAELREIIAQLGIRPAELLRKKEAKEEGVDPALDDDALIAALVAHPRVIERPIVVKDGKAALGRPPERVLELL
ncbi:arsenate reductase (glutaredoxin) [Endothiovibrio diazotrophicus]